MCLKIFTWKSYLESSKFNCGYGTAHEQLSWIIWLRTNCCMGKCDGEKFMTDPMVSKLPKTRLSRPQKTTTLPLLANGTKRPEMYNKIYWYAPRKPDYTISLYLFFKIRCLFCHTYLWLYLKYVIVSQSNVNCLQIWHLFAILELN